MNEHKPTPMLAIDPGIHGGLAYRDGPAVLFSPMPEDELALVELLRRWVVTPTIGAIEQVSGFIGQAHPGSSMFSFGQSYGACRTAMAAVGAWPPVEVRPQEWQKGLGLGFKRRGESDSQWKNRLKAAAQKLYHGLRVTLATADALLLLEHMNRRQA